MPESLVPGAAGNAPYWENGGRVPRIRSGLRSPRRRPTLCRFGLQETRRYPPNIAGVKNPASEAISVVHRGGRRRQIWVDAVAPYDAEAGNGAVAPHRGITPDDGRAVDAAPEH